MITLVGVGHVFAISDQVKGLIRSRHPEIVCLELDAGRYRALTEKRTSGAAPLQYRLLAYFQKRMAGKFGTEVGDEMMAAVTAAQEVDARIALIDKDATMMFAELWRRMSFRERISLIGGAFAGLFISKETVEKELAEYEEHADQYLDTLGKGFPAVKEVLIDDRNSYMAQQLISLSSQYTTVVAIVGDGHVPGIAQALKDIPVEVVRLKDLRKGEQQPSAAAEYSASYVYKNQ